MGERGELQEGMNRGIPRNPYKAFTKKWTLQVENGKTIELGLLEIGRGQARSRDRVDDGGRRRNTRSGA